MQQSLDVADECGSGLFAIEFEVKNDHSENRGRQNFLKLKENLRNALQLFLVCFAGVDTKVIHEPFLVETGQKVDSLRRAEVEEFWRSKRLTQ